MSSAKVLVVGGSGFLGQALVQALSQAGISFSYTFKSLSRPTTLKHGECAFYLDIQSTDFGFLDSQEFTHVVCLLPIANSLPLIKVCQFYPNISFIFTSTTAIYTSFASKFRSERLHAESLLLRTCNNCIIIRPTMITGSLIHDTVGRTLASFSSRGFGILPRPMLGSCLFQPIDVHDLSRLIVSFILTPLPLCALPHVCDVGGPEPIGFFQYFNSAAEIFNFRLIVLPLPFFVLLPTLKFLGSFGFNLFSSLHEKLYRLQEVKVVSNNIHPLVDFAPSPYWSSLARLRNDYFLRRLIS